MGAIGDGIKNGTDKAAADYNLHRATIRGQLCDTGMADNYKPNKIRAGNN